MNQGLSVVQLFHIYIKIISMRNWVFLGMIKTSNHSRYINNVDKEWSELEEYL